MRCAFLVTLLMPDATSLAAAALELAIRVHQVPTLWILARRELRCRRRVSEVQNAAVLRQSMLRADD